MKLFLSSSKSSILGQGEVYSLAFLLLLMDQSNFSDLGYWPIKIFKFQNISSQPSGSLFVDDGWHKNGHVCYRSNYYCRLFWNYFSHVGLCRRSEMWQIDGKKKLEIKFNFFLSFFVFIIFSFFFNRLWTVKANQFQWHKINLK